MKKVLFLFNIQSLSDVITNSSSELFVFNDGNSLDAVINILDNVYPNWRSEYYEPVLVKDAERDDLETFVNEIIDTWYERSWRLRDEVHSVEQAKEKVPDFKAFLQRSLARAGLNISVENAFDDFENAYLNFIPWELRQQLNLPWWSVQYSDRLYDLIREQRGNDVLLFSKGENPDWEYQEKLMDVAERHHLG